MPETSKPVLSVADLFAQRDAHQRAEREAAEQLQRKKEEEIAEFKSRLENFQLSEEHVQAVLMRVKRAFERGETELMLTAFPSSFCSDDGRAITNAGTPPINKPSGTDQSDEPAWLATLPKGARVVYEYWRQNLKPGGFRFSARIINVSIR
jgi:hypothetical protein